MTKEVTTTVFSLIDAERKILGFSLLEISASIIAFVLGFAFNQLLFACVGTFGAVPVIRYVKHLLKKGDFVRRGYFLGSDLICSSKKGYGAKFYL